MEGMRVGIDARMISWAKASVFNQQLQKKGAKLIFPTQNLVKRMCKESNANMGLNLAEIGLMNSHMATVWSLPVD